MSPFGPNVPRPFVFNTLMPSHWEPWSFTEIPDCPQSQISNILWVQEKEPKYYCISKSPVNETPSMFPKRGSLWKQTPVSRVFLYISFRVPSKRTLPPGSPHRAPTERDTPFPEPSFIYLSVPSKRTRPPQVPQWGPYGERCPFPEPSFTLPLIQHNLTFLSKSRVNEPPSMFPQWGPYGERCSISRANS